jgi:2-methylcitrate dehydratase
MLSAPMTVHLQPNVNQALGIGQFACDFMQNARPGALVEERTKLFHTDSVLCGISAVALGTNAPCLLREEALEYRRENGVPFFGSSVKVAPEKAIVANSSAVREWDSNGTNFGFRKELGFTAGEFGHNDFYPVAIAAAQMKGRDGAWALKGMMLSDEIRGRLAEVFSLKTYKIDHVVHGAIASAATWGAMMGATPEQIESAIGMVVAHYIPWRAIRAGKQLSDSKGASAAISTEVAVLSMMRSMRGFVGPKDIFRNPESMFRQFQKTQGDSPFPLVMSTQGDDFAVMGMHFKLGLYEHQSAGALQGMIDLMRKHPEILENPETIKGIKIVAYEPAFGIIGDPAKRDPKTRQSADHSMVYIVGTLLRKAVEKAAEMKTGKIADGNREQDDPRLHGEDGLRARRRRVRREVPRRHPDQRRDHHDRRPQPRKRVRDVPERTRAKHHGRPEGHPREQVRAARQARDGRPEAAGREADPPGAAGCEAAGGAVRLPDRGAREV